MLTQITLPQVPHPPEQHIRKAQSILRGFYSGTMTEKDIPGNAHVYNSGYAEREYIRNGKVSQNRRQHVFSIGPEFEKWVADNIHPFAYEAGISISVPRDLSFQGPHCDLRRRYVLNYIIDCGGENVRTQWWKEKGYPLERLHESGPEGKSYWVKDYADLELIDDVVFSPGIWILLNPKILHSVENITGYRSFLTVSLPDMSQFPWNNRIDFRI
jgi:hypothetical protein